MHRPTARIPGGRRCAPRGANARRQARLRAARGCVALAPASRLLVQVLGEFHAPARKDKHGEDPASFIGQSTSSLVSMASFKILTALCGPQQPSRRCSRPSGSAGLCAVAWASAKTRDGTRRTRAPALSRRTSAQDDEIIYSPGMSWLLPSPLMRRFRSRAVRRTRWRCLDGRGRGSSARSAGLRPRAASSAAASGAASRSEVPPQSGEGHLHPRPH